MATGIAAVGSWLGGLTAAQVTAGAAVLAAGTSAAMAMRKPSTPDAGQTLMPSKDVERKEDEEEVTLGSERGGERAGRKTGRASLMAPREQGPTTQTPGQGVKL